MTETFVHCTDDDLSKMLGTLLRSRTASGKDLARRIDCDPRAAEGYRAGRHLPPLPVFIRMVGALGHDLAEAVLDPLAAHARLSAEIAAHDQAAAAARQARDALVRAPARRPSLPTAVREG